VAVPLAGVAAFAAAGLLGIDCRPGWWTFPVGVLAVTTFASVTLAAWCAVTLTWPTSATAPAAPPLVEHR
jgi:hypothetical protein